MQGLLTEAMASGKIVASVCHGPVCLVNVKDAAGKHIIANRKARPGR